MIENRTAHDELEAIFPSVAKPVKYFIKDVPKRKAIRNRQQNEYQRILRGRKFDPRKQLNGKRCKNILTSFLGVQFLVWPIKEI